MAVICSRAKASLFAILIGLQNIMWVLPSTPSCLAVRPACLVTTTSDETRHIPSMSLVGFLGSKDVLSFFLLLGGECGKMGAMLDVW